MIRPLSTAVFCALLAVLLGVSGCPRSGSEEPPRVRIDGQRFRVDALPDDRALGGEQPLVTVIIFSDYACPPCGRTWQVMDNLVEDYGADLRVIWRGFTVPGFGRGEQAAEAALAAGNQGKFWPMHRRLFAYPSALDRPSLTAHAEAIGLDVPQFLDDLDTGAAAGPRIRHRREAIRLGISGLPATFVNGLYLAGFVDEATWHGIIDEEIAHARQLLAEGSERPALYTTLMAKASTARVSVPERADALREGLAVDAPRPKVLAAPQADARYRIEPGDAPAVGPVDAAVQVVAFFDFECPFCRKAWIEELRALIAARKDTVRFAFRQLPLEIHTAAEGAARAALAADRQHQFVAFIDKLMASEGPLGRDVFVANATGLGLDAAKFLRDLDDPAVAAAVDDDAKLASAVGVSGTPGFFVNGRYVRGYSPGELGGMIDEELAHAQTLVEAGVARKDVFEKLMSEAIGPEEFPNR